MFTRCNTSTDKNGKGGISIFRGIGQPRIACNGMPSDTWTALVMSIVNLMAQPQDKGLKSLNINIGTQAGGE